MDNAITIKFEMTNECGHHFLQESTFKVYYDLGERDIDCIGEQLNAFLKQAGYIRRNDLIFMEDITEEEYEALDDYLCQLRNEDGGENGN